MSSNDSLKVAVFEPGFSGHRLHYVSLILQAINDLGLQPVLMTTAEAVDSVEFRSFIGEISQAYELYELPDVFGARYCGIADVKSRSLEFDRVICEVAPDHLLIPTSETLFPIFVWRQATRFKPSCSMPFTESLFLSPGHGYRAQSFRRRIGNPIVRFCSRRLPIDVYAHVDPYQLETVATKKGTIEYVVMPDPVPTPCVISQDSARKKLGIRDDGRFIGICGAISASKGVHDLTRAFKLALPALRPNDRLLLAGSFSDETREFIFSENQELIESKRIVAIDKFLSNDEIDWAFHATDLYCVAQIGRPGSSGTLLRAVAAGKPVLARDRFWSGRITKRFGLGWVSETWNPEKFCQSIIECMAEIDDFKFQAKSKSFIQFHSEKNFQATWMSKVRQRLGLPRPAWQLGWDEVTSD